MTMLSKYSFVALIGTVLGAYPKGELVDHSYCYIDKIGPFSLEKNQILNLNVKYHLNAGRPVKPYFCIFNGDSRTLFREEGEYITTIRHMPYYWSTSIDLKDYVAPNGLQFMFGMIDERYYEYQILHTEFSVFPIGLTTINPFTLPGGVYESKPYAYHSDENDEYSHIAKYDFNGLIEYTNDTDFSYLEYSTCSFTYDSVDEDFTYEDAYIKFYDTKHLFNKWRTSSDGCKHIKLRLMYTKSLKLVDIITYQNYYLNRDTMEISDIYRDGFTSVGRFYLPYNFMAYAKDYTFSVELVGVGADKLNVSYPLVLGNNKNHFGLCNSSDYCVIGGIAK